MAVKMLSMQKFPTCYNQQEIQHAQSHFINKSINQSKSFLDINRRRRRSHPIHNNAACGDDTFPEFRCEEEVSGNRSRRVERLAGEFNPKIPIEEAFTPPSSWYTDPEFYAFELNRVFYTGWQVAGTPLSSFLLK